MLKPSPSVALAALVAVTAVAVPATSSASTPAAPNCLLREHRIASVTPHRVEEQIGKSAILRLRGAEVLAQAEPGLPTERLQLTLVRHIAEMRGLPTTSDCVFDLDDVAVRVDSGGTKSRVRTVARDTEKAEEVLRRVRRLPT